MQSYVGAQCMRRRLRHEMSLQQCAWGSSDAAFEVSRRCLTFGRLEGMPIPAPSAGRGPGPSQHSLSPDCSLVPSVHLYGKEYFLPSPDWRELPRLDWVGFYFTLLQVGEVPSVSYPWGKWKGVHQDACSGLHRDG